MIYFTGDIHGDRRRFKKCRLKKDDYLIICGDFGFIWNGSKKEKKILKRLGKRRYNILFVDGAHENYDELLKYPIEEWKGGKTRLISGRLRQLMRGEVFEIGGKKIFAFGGGMLDEADLIYENYENQGAPEIPTIEEYKNGTVNLNKCDNNVDFIASYEAPGQIAEFIELSKPEKRHLNTYFDKISENCSFKRWYFGHHHINKIVSVKYTAIYDKIVAEK